MSNKSHRCYLTNEEDHLLKHPLKKHPMKMREEHRSRKSEVALKRSYYKEEIRDIKRRKGIEVDDSKYLEEELKKERRLVRKLEQDIEYKNKQITKTEDKLEKITALFDKYVIDRMGKYREKERELLEWKHMYHETSITVEMLMEENNKLNEGIGKIKDILNSAMKYDIDRKNEERENVKQLIKEIGMMKNIYNELRQAMECQTENFEKQAKEFEEWKSKNDIERECLMDQIKKLKGKYQNQTPNMNDGIIEMRKELEEKRETLQDLESLNRLLRLKEYMSNQELQDARKESIRGLKDILSSRTTLGIKFMGEIDKKAFQCACADKFINGEESEVKSAELLSSWQQEVKDPHWHPFMTVIIKGNPREVINEDDEKLKDLRNQYGVTVYEAVANALLEINEYNASGRYVVPEIWNFKEGRKANLKEVIQYIITRLKTHNRKTKCR